MMKHPWLLLLLLHSIFSQTTDKYSDEDRPYKFGFNIEGYQHRKEEKNEKGIIMGEYGFITADGYYRVTVYATDENGDFKILSMKNYYVGFPPEDPTTTPGPPSRSGNARPQLSFGSQPGPAGREGGSRQPGPAGRKGGSRQPDPAGKEDGSRQPAKPLAPQGVSGCSNCFIPTTTQKPSQFNQGGGFGGGNVGSRFGGSPGQGPAAGGFGGSGGSFGQGPAGGESPRFPQGTPGGSVRGPAGGQSPGFPQGGPRGNAQGPAGGQRGSQPTFGSIGPTGPGSSFVGDSPQNQGGVPGSPNFPTGRNDFPQNNQLDGGGRQRPQIGDVRNGLPPGVTVDDIKNLLYTFNYTVGFHGHHEDGYTNGEKLGDYFFDGRDGVERRVEYLANEFGYQPNITFIDLPENDIRRPNEQTEKEYGLKGYEFKWFYRK